MQRPASSIRIQDVHAPRRIGLEAIKRIQEGLLDRR
jgi:hypothetical protein